MANLEHVAILQEGAKVWNQWRAAHKEIRPDLSEINWEDLRNRDLAEINFSSVDLFGAHLAKAPLKDVNLHKANLREADLIGAVLIGANLRAANFREAKLQGAMLTGADLSFATLVKTKLQGADLTGSKVYGISAWRIEIDDKTKQNGLIVSAANAPQVTVDNLEFAQFIDLLLNNSKIRHVIDTVTAKVVLILGRFTDERKAVLEGIREELQKHDYVPILFDFKKPESKDIHETVTTLARMARFVIADITDPKSIPQELVSIVEQLPSLAVQPLLLQGGEPWGMYDHIKRYPWVLPVALYNSQDELLSNLAQKVILPVEAKVKEIRGEGKST